MPQYKNELFFKKVLKSKHMILNLVSKFASKTNMYIYIVYQKNKISKVLVHVFHKTRRLNLQPAKLKIKSTLLNIEAII